MQVSENCEEVENAGVSRIFPLLRVLHLQSIFGENSKWKGVDAGHAKPPAGPQPDEGILFEGLTSFVRNSTISRPRTFIVGIFTRIFIGFHILYN